MLASIIVRIICNLLAIFVSLRSSRSIINQHSWRSLCQVPNFLSQQFFIMVLSDRRTISSQSITQDDIKCYYIVASSLEDSLTETHAPSIIIATPATLKFAAINNFLLSAFELSDYERAAANIGNCELELR